MEDRGSRMASPTAGDERERISQKLRATRFDWPLLRQGGNGCAPLPRGERWNLADVAICVPSDNTQHIQEAHPPSSTSFATSSNGPCSEKKQRQLNGQVALPFAERALPAMARRCSWHSSQLTQLQMVQRFYQKAASSSCIGLPEAMAARAVTFQIKWRTKSTASCPRSENDYIVFIFFETGLLNNRNPKKFRPRLVKPNGKMQSGRAIRTRQRRLSATREFPRLYFSASDFCQPVVKLEGKVMPTDGRSNTTDEQV